MEWITCPKCGFTQVPSEKCLRCERILERQELAVRRPPRPAPASPSVKPRSPAPAALLAASALLLLLAGILFWKSRASKAERTSLSAEPAATAFRSLNLAGRWQTQVSETLPGPPARPAVKEAYLETDRDGAILAAGVLLTDPGRGGAGAGYRIVADGRRRLEDILPRLAAAPAGTELAINFIPLPPWMPTRSRLWRALEGQRPRAEDVRYLVLESVEDDYLVQAGINQTGFLSYVFFSPEYASGRGLDTLSAVIHPEPNSSLRGFRNLAWDFSGAADFLRLEVYASLSGPEGVRNRMTLKRIASKM